MAELVKNRRADDVWACSVAAAWSALALATDIKGTVPYIHWIAAFVALLLITPYLLRTRSRVRFPSHTAIWLLVAAACIPVFYGAPALYSLAEAAKLAIILAGGLLLFATHGRLAHYGFKAFIFVVLLNVVFLFGGFLGLPSAVPMAAAGRWGTVLSFPGELWRVGITVWVFAAYRLAKRRSVVSLLLFFASNLLVYADGARTGLLLVAAGGLYLVFVFIREWEGSMKALAFTLITVVALGIGIAALVFHSADSVPEGAVTRLTQFGGALDGAGVQGLEVADAQRFLMLQTVLTAIQKHPVFGTGILTTTVPSIVGPQPIHMTYLEVWADMGLLGLAAYVCVVWGWVVWLPRAFRHTRALSDPTQRALYYNAIFLLIVYGLTGFFHPLSTEWSEWIVFIIPYALVWEVSRFRIARFSLVEAYA
jgi:O-antigen ligase